MTYSRHTPLPCLSWLQRLLWPLIYLRLVALKAWVRAHYGRGVPYYYAISRFGRVRLVHMPIDFARSGAACPAALAPVRPEARLFRPAAACLAACQPEAAPRAPAPRAILRLLMAAAAPAPAGADTS